MAKTIKFNLICDDKPVRTIEDLQQNFSIEDVLSYYENGLLLRWLKVREYEQELKKVSAIKSKEKIDIMKELIKIFDIETEQKKVEEGVYMIQFAEKRAKMCEKYKNYDIKLKNMMDEYKSGYEKLVEGIIDNPNDIAKIKANIAEIVANYNWILELNHRALFWKLEKKSVLSIMCLLMNETTRKYYLPLKIERDADSNSNTTIYDVEVNPDKSKMYEKICRIVDDKNFKNKLGQNLHVFAGDTDGYWNDIETKGKKYMIIKMASASYVRPTGVNGGDLSSNDVNNEFIIIDGIDYKGKYKTDELLYMEV